MYAPQQIVNLLASLRNHYCYRCFLLDKSAILANPVKFDANSIFEMISLTTIDLFGLLLVAYLTRPFTYNC